VRVGVEDGVGVDVAVCVGVSVCVAVGVGVGGEVVVAVGIVVGVATRATVAVGVACCTGLTFRGGRPTMSTTAKAIMLATLLISFLFRAISPSLPCSGSPMYRLSVTKLYYA
jgi:hypothetical protein